MCDLKAKAEKLDPQWSQSENSRESLINFEGLLFQIESDLVHLKGEVSLGNGSQSLYGFFACDSINAHLQSAIWMLMESFGYLLKQI